MNPVTRERTRTCIRCHERFTEPAGTATRICDDCSGGGSGGSRGVADGGVAGRDRKRTCLGCGEPISEAGDEGSRLCPSCDPDHVLLD